MTKITVDGVLITLTPDQLRQIDEQRGKITKFHQVDSYDKACKVLSIIPNPDDTVSNKIKTIARAINILIEDRTFPDWRKEGVKWYPYFQLAVGRRLVFRSSDYGDHYFYGLVAYLKTQEASDYMGKTFTHLYEELSQEKF